MNVGALALALLMVPVLVLAGTAPASGADAHPVCIGLKAGGLGSPRIDLTLSAVNYGAFVHLAGEARFSQSIAPPNGLIVYSVSGTAIPNDDGFWISLSGAGYNTAKTVFNGTFAIQANADPTQNNTLTYSRQSLDGSSTVILTGTPELKVCP